MDGEEEDADEEDGDYDEDFGEEEEEGFGDSEGEEFEEDYAQDDDQGKNLEDLDPNREPTAREKAAMMLDINRPLYPVYRGILAEVNLISSILLSQIAFEFSTPMSNFLKIFDLGRLARGKRTLSLRRS